ncbi:MAG: hypothetical protein K2Q03_05450 [Sphingobacteriaceae bacterium]|nr:hypothetical protein [Sphingobacteriaceae bacterium]
MKTSSVRIILYRIITGLFGMILIDYLCDGNLNTTCHLLQVGHNYFFHLNPENLLCYFHLHKQLLFTIDAFVRQMGLNNIVLIVLAKSLITAYRSLLILKFNISHQRNNFSHQYKNSFTLHTDISQANIALP